MKIILVANVAKDHVLKFHVPTLKCFSEKGWIVDVACGGDDPVPYCHKQIKLPIDRSPFKTRLFKAVRQLSRIILSEKYDIVYCHTSVGSVVAKIASVKARKLGTKVIHFAHGTYFYKGAPIYNWVLYYPIFKLLSFITDATITITEEDYRFSMKHFSHAKTYYVEGIGVDPQRFHISNKEEERIRYRNQLKLPKDAIVLIYLAEISRNKNQKLLLDMLSEVLTNRNDVYLVLAGRDFTNGALQYYARQLNLADNVLFLGWRSDVPLLLNMSDICTASSIREGLGLNLIESMICGLPVVATLNSGHRAVIKDGENGFLVPLNNKHLFAEKVLQLVGDKKLRDSLSEKALSDIDKYYTDNVLVKLIKIIDELVS